MISKEFDKITTQDIEAVFDSLWQAAGWNECKHYPDGTWRKPA
jgi:hypothetical protein